MICGGAYYSIARQLLGRPSLPITAFLFASLAHASVASAAETVDCASINLGRLDMALASGSSTLRAVEMSRGDTLAFTFRADARAKGTITLVAGDGREQRLLYGPTETQISYTAEQSGTVGFRLATQGGKTATFLTTCSPAIAPDRNPDAAALDGLNIDMTVPLAFGATASKDHAATTVAAPAASGLQWLGAQQSGTEAPASTYGVNLKLQPAIMIGMLAQFDRSGGDPLLGPPALSDQAWMAGPVTKVQLGTGLSLDARVAWGPTAPGPYATGHGADRQTLDARLVSKQEAGPWRFSPSIGLSHTQERLGTVVAPSADLPGQQTIESGRVDVKPEMAYRIDMGHSAFIEPRLMIGTFWNLGDAASGAALGAQHEARHMAETGVTVGASDGTKLQVGAGVQEGETRSDNVWSGRLQLNIPLK